MQQNYTGDLDLENITSEDHEEWEPQAIPISAGTSLGCLNNSRRAQKHPWF